MLLQSWISSSLKRIYPSNIFPKSKAFEIEGALNEKMSFQVSVRFENDDNVNKIKVIAEGPSAWNIRVRRVGYVPVAHQNTPILQDGKHNEGLGHIPGCVPDPLFDEDSAAMPCGETNSFWISLKPHAKAAPGNYSIKITVLSEKTGEKNTHSVKVKLHDIVIGKRKNFPVTHWFYMDALIDWYKTDYIDERLWKLLGAYFRNIAEHGQDTIYVPVFTPPLDGVKRPSQLLHVTKKARDKYSFDWSDVKKYIGLAKKSGLEFFEWSHLFTQWGAANAIRIYEGQGKDGKLLWKPELEATSKTYRLFLTQFLNELHNFVKTEKISDKSFFHLSDEPHGDEHKANYQKARNMLNEIAPWMKVMDALSGIEFAREKLTDMPVPTIRAALDFLKENIPCWCYYCCGPRGKFLNHLMDTPLAKIAMHGMLFYRWPFQGFLHWGYNYWYRSQTTELINPFTVQDGLAYERGWAYGDTFLVYPGAEGPVDSIRWEIFGESMQDYALLQTLGIDRNDKMLSQLKAFDDFPLTEDWRRNLKSRLYKRH
ncbi:MAG: hypothetical protein A2017_19675 [Lentisphaerae bacterium GWF2_44_16]|nr:MAG: hypothetical protein A2017_19675 [Lentisphaerae bacterium GWF2_44_16]